MSGDRKGAEEISLYFHVPFCSRKCDYCHFYVIPPRPLYHAQLMEGLLLEWEFRKAQLQDKQIVSIYFGGGTPFLLGAKEIGRILSWIKNEGSIVPYAEVTLEANPEHLTEKVVADFTAAGINRMSLGVQSFDDNLLKLLSREHRTATAISAIEQTIKGGIVNLSIDLMYDLPTQTLEQWETTLDIAFKLPITHLSLYNLTFEPHTVFYKRRNKLQSLLPKEEDSRIMYERTIQLGEDKGFIQYEISAFARDEKFSHHNCGYWQGRPFLGFGPSAFSYWEGSRFRNIAHLNRWLQALKENNSPTDFTEKLSMDAQKRELLAIGLRLSAGVNLLLFEKKYGPLDLLCHQQLEYLQQRGYLIKERDHLRLTPEGRLFYDTVAVEII